MDVRGMHHHCGVGISYCAFGRASVPVAAKMGSHEPAVHGYCQSGLVEKRVDFDADPMQRAVRASNAAMNIVTDLLLAITPTSIILQLQIGSQARISLLIGLWSRIL